MRSGLAVLATAVWVCVMLVAARWASPRHRWTEDLSSWPDDDYRRDAATDDRRRWIAAAQQHEQ